MSSSTPLNRAAAQAAPSVPVLLGSSLGLLFIVPFLVYYRPPPLGDFHTEWVAVVLLALSLVGGVRALPRRFPVRWGLLALPLTLSLIVLVQLLLGRYSYAYDWVLWLAYLAVFGIALTFGQGLQSAGLVADVTRRIAWAIVMTAIAQVFTQLAQVFGMEQAFYPFVVHLMEGSVCRIHGNIGQANQATTIAWFGVAAALYLLQTQTLGRVVGILVISVLLLSSALTASRMAWLFCGIVVLAIFWTNADGRRSIGRPLSLAIALVAGFVIANATAVHLIRLVNDTCVSGLDRLAADGGLLAIRWSLWRQALLVWAAHPWLGSGAGSFIGQAFILDQAPGNQPLDSYAHNSLLQLLAEFGAVGALAGIGLLVWSARSVYKNRGRIDPHRRLLLVWIAILLTYSMLEFPLWYTHFLILFGLSAGLVIQPDEGRWICVRRPSIFAGAAALCLAAGSAYAAYDYRKAERAFALASMAPAVHAVGTPQLASVLDEISKETHLYRLHLEYALDSAMPMTTEYLQTKLEKNTRLTKRIPLAGPVARQVLLLTMAGDLDNARWYLRRLLKFAPPETSVAVEDMRRLIRGSPDRFEALGPILDAELSATPVPAVHRLTPKS